MGSAWISEQAANFFLIRHSQTGFYNRRGECLQRGTD